MRCNAYLTVATTLFDGPWAGSHLLPGKMLPAQSEVSVARNPTGALGSITRLKVTLVCVSWSQTYTVASVLLVLPSPV